MVSYCLSAEEWFAIVFLWSLLSEIIEFQKVDLGVFVMMDLYGLELVAQWLYIFCWFILHSHLLLLLILLIDGSAFRNEMSLLEILVRSWRWFCLVLRLCLPHACNIWWKLAPIRTDVLHAPVRWKGLLVSQQLLWLHSEVLWVSEFDVYVMAVIRAQPRLFARHRRVSYNIVNAILAYRQCSTFQAVPLFLAVHIRSESVFIAVAALRLACIDGPGGGWSQLNQVDVILLIVRIEVSIVREANLTLAWVLVALVVLRNPRAFGLLPWKHIEFGSTFFIDVVFEQNLLVALGDEGPFRGGVGHVVRSSVLERSQVIITWRYCTVDIFQCALILTLWKPYLLRLFVLQRIRLESRK